MPFAALELIPNSVQLWKAAIELEDTEDAIILLGSVFPSQLLWIG